MQRLPMDRHRINWIVYYNRAVAVSQFDGFFNPVDGLASHNWW
jgi:hypothetical protein